MRQEEIGEGIASDVTLTDAHGVVLVEVSGLRSRAAKEAVVEGSQAAAQALYRLDWSASRGGQGLRFRDAGLWLALQTTRWPAHWLSACLRRAPPAS